MNSFVAICLLALLPVCATLNCYSCLSGSTGCNDPFSSSGSGVSQTGSVSGNTYCVKSVTAGIAYRYGSSSCTAVPFTTVLSLSTGMACCQSDLCNGARTTYQASILLVLSLAAIFAKFQWA